MSRQYLLQIDDGDVAPYVLLPGDPDRVPIVASMWDEAREVAHTREYRTMTGVYKGMPVTCTSTGIGCPSAAIAMEELAKVGATTFLRIGTCGTFRDDVANGDIAIFDSALRFDGTSALYAPLQYPAVAHYEVVAAAVEAARRHEFRTHVGTTRTSDTFYARHPHPGSSFNDFWQSDWREFFPDMQRLGVLGAEMETSVILTLAKIWGLRAGSMAAVLDNIMEVSQEDTVFDPDAQLDKSPEAIERLATLGCETLWTLWRRDQEGV